MKAFGVIIDLDGTLIHKGEATTGAKALIDFLNEQNIPFRVVTNSVGRTPEELSAKIKAVGIEIGEHLFLNPIVALNRYIKDNAVESYYFVGQKKISDLLAVRPKFDGFPEYIILSDLEQSDYAQLNQLFVYLKQGAKLLTMSMSEYYIAEGGLKLDTGAFTRMLEYHAESKAILFGKPSEELFNVAVEGMGLDSSSVVVIGDDVLTDVKGAKAFGLGSVLVRSGKYQKEDEFIDTPNLVVNNLLELVDALNGDILKNVFFNGGV